MRKRILLAVMSAVLGGVSVPVLAQQALQTQQAPAVVFPINLNTATDAEILAVPSTGPRFLREFKEYRPYVNIEQFERELGKYVDQAQVKQWEQYVFVPTNPNTATAYQLMTLKGVDKAMADYIIAGRPYKDWSALRAVLLKKYDAKTVDALQRYWIFG